MDFSEWIDTTLDDEKDTLCLMDAWRAGASAMLERLVELGYIDQSYESFARKKVKDLVKDRE